MLRLRLFFGLLTLILLQWSLGVAALMLMKDMAGKNILFVVTFMLLGTAVACLMYFQLIKLLVDPVVSLYHSLGEIRRGNLDLLLPQPKRGSEFAELVAAFNKTVAELKLRRGESDINLLRVTMINRAILEAIPSPVFLIGEDNEIVRVNRAAERLTENLGLNGGLPYKIQRILDECRKNLTNFLPQEPQEAILFRIDEQEYYFLPRIFRFDSGTDSQYGWAILLHNVTRIRWLDEMKTNLLATISHEIKTPLTGIRMALFLMLEKRFGPMNEKQEGLVSSASDDCEHLLITLNNLLDLTRAERGTTRLERVPFAIQTSVERAIQLFAGTAANREITLRHEAPETNPPKVYADPIRLDEVLNNLISNAIKHSPDGGEVTLRLSTPDERHLRVSVTDQGPGVPEACRNLIFERFYRAPGQKDQGTGLGLFLCREIMQAHEGRIGLRDRASGSDTTEFYIDIPIA